MLNRKGLRYCHDNFVWPQNAHLLLSFLSGDGRIGFDLLSLMSELFVIGSGVFDAGNNAGVRFDRFLFRALRAEVRRDR